MSARPGHRRLRRTGHDRLRRPEGHRLRRTAPLAGAALAAFLAFLVAGCNIERATGDFTGAGDPPGLQRQVTTLLERSAEAWNGGDLDGFMSSYERAPSTTFAADSELLVGWDAIREHYAPRFAPHASRDSLEFEDIRTRALGQRHAVATARWVLVRDGEVSASGPFTLVLMRVEGSWRIIHDHSSSAEPHAAAEG